MTTTSEMEYWFVVDPSSHAHRFTTTADLAEGEYPWPREEQMEGQPPSYKRRRTVALDPWRNHCSMAHPRPRCAPRPTT